jgi:FlaA1/EpsC-like NDP-sugar epimerase
MRNDDAKRKRSDENDDANRKKVIVTGASGAVGAAIPSGCRRWLRSDR